MDTINRLLKRQAPKRKPKTTGPEDGDAESAGPSALFVRTVMNASGTTVSVPTEWLEAPATVWPLALPSIPPSSLSSSSSTAPAGQPSWPRMVQEIE